MDDKKKTTKAEKIEILKKEIEIRHGEVLGHVNAAIENYKKHEYDVVLENVKFANKYLELFAYDIIALQKFYNGDDIHWCLVVYADSDKITPYYYTGEEVTEGQPVLSSMFDKALKLSSKIEAEKVLASFNGKHRFGIEAHAYINND